MFADLHKIGHSFWGAIARVELKRHDPREVRLDGKVAGEFRKTKDESAIEKIHIMVTIFFHALIADTEKYFMGPGV